MKATIHLAIALFLIGAPAPDSSDIAELTSNLIVPDNAPGLQADTRLPVLDAAPGSIDGLVVDVVASDETDALADLRPEVISQNT